METENKSWHIAYAVYVTKDNIEYGYYVEEAPKLSEAVQRVEERLEYIFGDKFKYEIFHTKLIEYNE